MKETKFKQTDIGLIPEDWDIKEIGNFTEIVTGATPSTQIQRFWYQGTIRWMSSGEVNLKYVREVIGRITEDGYRNASTHLLPPHCVLIGLAGQGKTRGTAAYNLISLCTNQSIGSILPNDSYCSLFLYHYMDAKYNDLRLLSAGDGGRGGLNKKLLSEYKVPLPPTIEEQERIANALSQVDDLLAALDEQIEKKQLVKQGAMQQLLTGKTRLQGFRGEWKTVKLGEIGNTFNGLSGKSAVDFGTGNAKYVTFLNVLNNPIIDTSILENVNINLGEKQNAVHKGDLFFNTSSETPEEVGICAVILEEIKNLYLNSFCFGFRLFDENVDGKYLAFYFRSKTGRDLMTTLAQGATRYNLSKSAFDKSEITIPSTLAEQQAIANILSTMDDEIQALQEERDKYALVKQGMMQQLLTGKIRLK